MPANPLYQPNCHFVFRSLLHLVLQFSEIDNPNALCPFSVHVALDVAYDCFKGTLFIGGLHAPHYSNYQGPKPRTLNPT